MVIIMGWQSVPSAGYSALTAVTQCASGSGSGAQGGSDPGLPFDVLEWSRKIKYEAGGRNIFGMETKTSATTTHRPQLPPQTPPAANEMQAPTQRAEIPIKYYGFANKPGEPLRVFLQHRTGKQIFVAAQGDIVGWRYRVVQIAPNSVMLEDVLTSDRQPVPLTLR
jgi:hypothetical protein